MNITFLGAVGTVTGSKYLIQQGEVKILVDCGLFQGPAELTKRNREPLAVDPKSITALVLTHAHIDHTGYIPLLVKNGFKGPIYCSKPTAALCPLLLRDSASLQEETAKRMNEHGDLSHGPVVPLYTVQDAENSIHLFQAVAYDTPVTIGPLQVTLIRSGHILGSAFIVISDGTRKLTFSGDLGRPKQFLMIPPPALSATDFLVLESTYGNRIHGTSDPLQQLAQAINQGYKRGGKIIIPSFAVERTQEILYCLYQLRHQHAIPDMPIFLDSPLGTQVTDLFCEFPDEHQLDPATCRDIFKIATYTHTVEESKHLDTLEHPAIIIAGSGMADGGRVVFHLQRYIGYKDTTVLFVGYQAQGTLGRVLVEGAKEVHIHGRSYAVHAHIGSIQTLSAHADSQEILQWLSHFKTAPQKVFLTHGEPESAQALAKSIEDRFGWSVIIPQYLASYDLV